MAKSWIMTVTVEDGKEQRGTVSANIPSSVVDLVDIRATATEYANLLGDTLIGGTIKAVSVSIPCVLPANLGAGSADSDIEEGALMIFETAGGWKTRFRVPTYVESKFVAGSRLIDETDAKFILLRDFMLTGWTAPSVANVSPSDSRDDDIIAFDKGYEQFRSSRPFSKG